jgi:hypothetical protein
LALCSPSRDWGSKKRGSEGWWAYQGRKRRKSLELQYKRWNNPFQEITGVLVIAVVFNKGRLGRSV